MSGAAGWAEVGRFVVSRPRGAAPRHLFANLFAPHGRRERWLGWLARRSAAVRRSLLCPAGDSGRQAGERLGGVLAEAAGDDWILCRPRADDRRGRWIAFGFDRGAASPSRVVKLRRAAAAGASLRREAATLELLGGRLPPALAATLPRVVAQGTATVAGERWETLTLAPLAGRSAYVEMQASLLPRRRVERHLAAAVDWLFVFQAATGDGAAVAAHGDLWPRNLLLPAGRVLPSVVDWEHHRAAATPFDDLFHFALTYVLAFPWRGRRRAPGEAFVRGFCRRGPVARVLGHQLGRFAAGHGEEPRELAACFRTWLVGWAAGGGDDRGALVRRAGEEAPCVFSG